MNEIVKAVTDKYGVAKRRTIDIDSLSILDAQDRNIYLASIEPLVCELSDKEIGESIKKCISWIMRDVGYKCNDEAEMQYIVVRTMQILRKYYESLSIKDFRLAFELLVIGELDDYLPKNGQGQPDRQHYQQFSIEYICKILNAYERRRNVILKRVRDAQPKDDIYISAAEKKVYREATKRTLIETYQYYRRERRLPVLSPTQEVTICNYLAEVGLLEELPVSLEEQENIMLGITALMTGKKQKESGRRNAIQDCFSRLDKDNINIENYV